MRRLTLCLAYYRNAGMLKRQFKNIRELPKNVRDSISVVVVDDGSPQGFEAQGEPIGCPISIYRIEVDIRWNQDAARNIAVHNATGKWVLLTDMDHIPPKETLAFAALEKHDKSKVYRFSRMTLESDNPPVLTEYKPHPNSWLMTKGMYDQIGGYDERFAGHYGTDAEFRDRVQQNAIIEMLPHVLWRVPRETIPDASTTTYTRKNDPIDAGAIPKIKAARNMNPAWKTQRLTFAYRKVYECSL